MKKIIFLLLVAVSISYSQNLSEKSFSSNPDGDRISIHITPFLNSGSLYQNDEFTTSYKSVLNFDVRIKIPFGKNLTFTPFYEQRNFDLSYKQIISIKTSEVQTKAGMTISFYF